MNFPSKYYLILFTTIFGFGHFNVVNLEPTV